MNRSTISERALVLAPRGRDAAIAVGILSEAGTAAESCESLTALIEELDRGAALAVVTEEALATADLGPLSAWIEGQEEWSDLAFVLLTSHGGGIERNPAARRYLDVLGNVTFVERPFHPTTLISSVRSALRGRRRQYEARARLEALRESERRYRALFKTIDEGFAVIEFLDGPHGPLSDYVHVEANPAYEVHAGIPNIVGKRLREIVSESEADAWADVYRRVLVTGEPIRFERELAETQRHLELAAFRVEPAERRHVAVLFQDITPRRRAQSALKELNETLEKRVAEALAERKVFADVVEGTDAFVQVVDLDYRWLAINKAAAGEFERIYGVRPRVGDSMLDLLAQQPEHQAAVQAVWARALAGEEFTATAEFGDVRRDRRFYEMKYNTLRNARGEQIGAYQFVYDVTERVSDQKRLVDAQDQLRQAQKMEAVGQLTGGVAHDFNNLLTIIKSSTELLRRPDLAEDRRARYVEAISETVARASKLTGQLLAFARRQSLKPEIFDVSPRILATTEMLTTIVGSRIRVVNEFPDDPCVVEVDASQLDTAIINMAVNARDAMDGEGTLTVRVQRVAQIPAIRNHRPRKGDFVRVSMGDTGCGIPADKLVQIFEPFFTTKEVGRGTGLGLSQVYGFAKQSGGDIQVESTVGQGTTFSLYLPRVENRASPEDPGPDVAGIALGETAGRKARVLVVEDNLEVGSFTTQILQDLGYDTTWAASAFEALDLIAEEHRFDVVFTDVIMPGMSGIDLGQQIRRRYPDLPVVLTSGYSQVLAEEGRHGFELLKKPYAAEELSLALRRVISGQRSA